MRRWFVSASMVLAATLSAQEPAKKAPSEEGAVAAAKQKLLAELAKDGIDVDLQRRTITISTVVNDPPDPLEYLLIHPRGKAHEALLMSEVKPSLLNSAFLLLGYDKGENAAFQPIEPPPSQEEIMKGAEVARLIPPHGMPVWMTVRWQPADADEEREAPVEDWIMDLTTEKPVVGASWVYLGGRMASLYRGEPEVFVADYEGNEVSTCYMDPANHLVTMVQERARDDENWWKTDACPPPGTEVKLRFWATKPAIVAEREKKLAEKPGSAGGQQDRESAREGRGR